MYETTPGEHLKSLLSPCSTPSTPLAESPRYIFDINAPSLPPPRKASVSIQPKVELQDEIGEIKASMKRAELPPLQQSGDEYMIMNATQPKGITTKLAISNGCMQTVPDKWGNEDEYVTLN